MQGESSSLFFGAASHLYKQYAMTDTPDRHYVAFIRKPILDEGGKESWVLFNDEKVVKAEGDVDEMKKFAYVYFFERV